MILVISINRDVYRWTVVGYPADGALQFLEAMVFVLKYYIKFIL
jgi:hypothetical protein